MTVKLCQTLMWCYIHGVFFFQISAAQSEIDASSLKEDSLDQSPLMLCEENPLGQIDSTACAALLDHHQRHVSALPPNAGEDADGQSLKRNIALCVCVVLCCNV